MKLIEIQCNNVLKWSIIKLYLGYILIQIFYRYAGVLFKNSTNTLMCIHISTIYELYDVNNFFHFENNKI